MALWTCAFRSLRTGAAARLRAVSLHREHVANLATAREQGVQGTALCVLRGPHGRPQALCEQRQPPRIETIGLGESGDRQGFMATGGFEHDQGR